MKYSPGIMMSDPPTPSMPPRVPARPAMSAIANKEVGWKSWSIKVRNSSKMKVKGAL